MNIPIEYVFINPELDEIKNIKNKTIKAILKYIVRVIGKDWTINTLFDFSIK